MRVVCLICTELFDGISPLSAVLCGHVFHADCLSRWLNTNLSCPQCRTRVTRKGVISKLFFSQPDKLDDGDRGPLSSQLENELDSLKANTRQKDFELSLLLAEKLAVDEKLQQAKENFRNLESLHKQGVDKIKVLNKELINYHHMQQQANAAKQEAAELRKKLVNLQNVQKVVNCCEDEIEAMIQQSSDLSQLATWCCVYKRELDRKKSDYRELQESSRQMKKELDATKSSVSDKLAELTSYKEQVKCLEDDVKNQDQQIKSLKKKIEALQEAIASPSSTAASFARRLISESPAPLATPKQPPRIPRVPVIDLDVSSDLFESPSNEKKRSAASKSPDKPPALTLKRKLTDQEKEPKWIKISTAADASSSKELSNGVSDIRNLSILKRTQCSLLRNTSSVFRQGFNGLGGRENFIQPVPKHKSTSFLKKSKS